MAANGIEGLLADLYTSFATGDAQVWDQLLTDDAACIGTGPDEWFVGKPGVMTEKRTQLAEMREAGIRVSGGTPYVVDNGDTVWAADRPTLHLGDGSRLSARLTVVAIRTDDGLRLQHFHLSVGLPG